MAFFTTNEFWASIIGAVATILSVWLTVFLGLRKLRDTEMSRLRIKCVTEIIAYRFVIVPTATPSTEARTAFYAALNAIPSLFGQDDSVMRHFRDFRETPASEKNAALLTLIRAVAGVANVPLTTVTDIDLLNPFR
ncbi:hypothetical protein [Gluconobacter sp. Gdi]|uniref:hypothetical protein n=1 Tax=Gluconobacter sp. Gdi TaxID=2691888 RepID=UPI001760C2F1|nr:hypothetical protein [Gluconobacter sp. Gdi]GFE97827.1 hypothetical protein DmGdi_29000 [Gluconobacter sp. Gdi]